MICRGGGGVGLGGGACAALRTPVFLHLCAALYVKLGGCEMKHPYVPLFSCTCVLPRPYSRL
jgi:hypothetical protein